MSNKITLFKDDNGFLSNFYPCTVTLDDVEYPSVEHAFQAAKTTDPGLRQKIKEARTPWIAKRMGRRVKVNMSVPAWNIIKVTVMYGLVKQKFTKEPFRTKLLDTGNAELIEGNWWGDTFWGVCMGKGENKLGGILMLVRGELCEGEKS